MKLVLRSAADVLCFCCHLFVAVRANVKHPLALGFGLSTRQHFVLASALADGVVIGSKIVKIIEDAPDTASRAANVEAFCKSIVNP